MVETSFGTRLFYSASRLNEIFFTCFLFYCVGVFKSIARFARQDFSGYIRPKMLSSIFNLYYILLFLTLI